jgi:hypothetical protein
MWINSLLAVSLAIAPGSWALEDMDIPVDAPGDAVMAGPAEVEAMHDWASTVFAGRKSSGREPAVRVQSCR